ncbi:MAG TPA: SHOCT domain-containing protein [Clostridia bacterium]|jgi:uncharacterized membrane protein|nr:SHOCT domain-containing protein [Clostridia bacterium]
MMKYYSNGLGNGIIGPLACIFGMLVFIAIVICVVLLIVHLSKSNKQQSIHSAYISNENNALKILNERLAKGEITVEEYNNIKIHMQK